MPLHLFQFAFEFDKTEDVLDRPHGGHEGGNLFAVFRVFLSELILGVEAVLLEKNGGDQNECGPPAGKENMGWGPCGHGPVDPQETGGSRVADKTVWEAGDELALGVLSLFVLVSVGSEHMRWERPKQADDQGCSNGDNSSGQDQSRRADTQNIETAAVRNRLPEMELLQPHERGLDSEQRACDGVVLPLGVLQTDETLEDSSGGDGVRSPPEQEQH